MPAGGASGGNAGGIGNSSSGNVGTGGGRHGGNNSGNNTASYSGGNNQRGNNNKKRRPLLETTKTWEPPQFIEGIKHNVEGYTDITQITRSGGQDGENTNRAFNKAQGTAYDDAIASFKRRQKLRLSIPSLPDSEALNLEGRRRAAQNRMRGRVGTMLSERETLG